MRRLLFSTLISLSLVFATSNLARANGPTSYGLGCGGIALNFWGKSFMHGPLYNYGPYYGYPPFEPYGPWNQYLQYGAYSGYGYAPPAPAYGGTYPSAPWPGTNAAPSTVQPPLAVPSPAAPSNGYGYGNPGSYNPYYPAPYPRPYVPQSTPVVPAQYYKSAPTR